MPLTIHAASVAAFDTMLGALGRILVKARAHCDAKKIEPEALTAARLYPDMFPFWRQVCLASDFAKGPVARLAGVEVPSWPDNERSLDELAERIERTRDYVRGFGADRFEGAAERTVTIKIGGQDMSMPGAQYLISFALPNFYFHLTTAYAILRHNGLEIGKRDFMGRT